jgi:hypothetical protein
MISEKGGDSPKPMVRRRKKHKAVTAILECPMLGGQTESG